MSMRERAVRAMVSGGVATLCVLGALSGTIDARQAPREPSCPDVQACRTSALAAEAAGERERFHDLAWRAMQLGQGDDAETMYLLARAQAMSGRPSDAVVMLKRLAQMGVATDADTLAVFERVRNRNGWDEVEALARSASRRVTTPRAESVPVPAEVSAADALPVPAPLPDASMLDTGMAVAAPVTTPDAAPVTPPATALEPASPAIPAPVTAPLVLAPLAGVELLRVEGLPTPTGGFAYDAVSGRFLVGSVDDRKIVVVDEPSRRASDLVRGDSAGFRNLVAMQIDTRRGDLWVVSNGSGATAGGATLHKLQLIAGRPLARIEPSAADGAVRFTDLTVTPGGTVLLVDAEGRRLFRAAPRATRLELVQALEQVAPVALTAAASDTVVYLAHAAGVDRIDLERRTSTPVLAGADVPLDGVERLWWHDGALVMIRGGASGERHAHRFTLDRRGVRVVSVQPLDLVLPTADVPIAAAVSGEDLFVMADALVPSSSSADVAVQRVVRRVRLRP